MKRTLSLILALLMLASTMTACGNVETKETEKSETKAVETNAPATEASATQAPETDAPAPSYDASLITENGVAKAHIVLAANASDKEKKAAEELVYHIKLVSGAEVPIIIGDEALVSGADVAVTNAAQEGSLPIVIATPDSLPDLEELFPEDLAWLRATGEVGDMERWGRDGFAVRQHNGKIYIFGAIPDGALNGTYDFIEENLDLIWINSTEAGIIYDEMPTINVIKADYREKSPFDIRYTSFSDNAVYTRNKHNTTLRPADHVHSVLPLLTSSPIYDPNITEYWDTDKAGNPLTASTTGQINYWSELTAVTVAASVIAKLDGYSDADRPKYWTVSQMDIYNPSVYPEMNEPFEYAPGQFVETSDPAYLSTVLFTFINRVARKVAEKYPDVTINTLSYAWSVKPPLCEVEDNVSVWFCPYAEDYTQPSFSVAVAEAEEGTSTSLASLEAKYYEEWVEKHPNVMLFTYYFCHYVQGWYERPIWDRTQNDFQYYASNGLLGIFTDGTLIDTANINFNWTRAGRGGYPADSPYHWTHANGYAMNLLSYWLFFKLAWNPWEDVDALIVKFCDKVYGEASDEMQEYYKLLEYGWNYGSTEILPYEFNAKITLVRDAQYYYDYFMDFDLEDGTFYPDAVRDALTKAYEAADDKAKEFIRYPYECFLDWTQFLE